MRKTLKSGKSSEDQIQKTFFEWVFAQEKVYPELKLLHHIPNQGMRKIIYVKKLKAMGMRLGWPDCGLPVARNGYHSLYIEFKSEEGELSEYQKEMVLRLSKQGCLVGCFNDAFKAIDFVKEYLGIK